MFIQKPQLRYFILLFSISVFINVNGQTYNPPVITSGGCTADSVIYTYSGNVQSFTVPSCVTSLTVRAWGAGGGGGGTDTHVGGTGGGGAYAAGTFTVTPGQVYAVVIGQGGAPGGNNVPATSGGGTGGFGGGNGGNGAASGAAGSSGAGGGGGGATSLLKAGTFVLVAGGGGGGGGGGHISAGAPGGGGGVAGNVTSTTSYDGSAGIVGASTDSVGLAGALNSHDGGGGGGGGGGDNGSGGGGAPTNSCDCGAGGGAGGNSLGTTVINGHGQTPGDSTYAALTTGYAKGGSADAGIGGAGGGNGYLVLSYCISTSLSINTATSNVLCYGENNGYAYVTITAGAGPFTYSWSTIPVQSTDTAKILSTGTYTVSVNNAGNCPATATVIITQPSALELNATAIATTCNGVCNGSATVIPKGGTSSYTYLWSDNSSGTSASISGLCQGNYSVTVRDANGCTHDTTVTVTQPIALLDLHDSVADNGSCNGIAAVTVAGGTSPYSYLWATGNQTSDTIKGQCQGTYCCTITDANKCTLNTCVTVNLFTGINNILNPSSVSIYPDPNTGNFTITGILPGEVIELYDCTGQKINRTTVDHASFNFDISEKPDGIYFIKVLDKDGGLIEQKKIVKSK